VEALNGILYIVIFAVNGTNADSVLYSIMVSALLVISVIDYRTMMIPVGADLVILAVSVIHLILHLNDWLYYVIGFLSVGLFLLLCALVFRAVTGKSGLGLGDVELMACASLCIGWGHGLFAVIVGSLLGVLVEGTKIIVTKEKGKFPFGPYLAVGIWIAMLWGDRLYDWYLMWIMG
jgi:leader peptidase (prepilin peptidase)/N-methyltransferase